jgi:hypothetical protein
MKSDFVYKNEWGVAYDPIEETMNAGYSMDGENFSSEFLITEIQEKDILIAIAICANLYSSYGAIVAPYKDLLELYKNSL